MLRTYSKCGLNHPPSDEGKSSVDRFKANTKPYRGQNEKILQQPSSFRDRICTEIRGRPETYRQRGNTFSWRNWIFWQPEEEIGEGSIQSVTTGQKLGEHSIRTANVSQDLGDTRRRSDSSIGSQVLTNDIPDPVTGTDEGSDAIFKVSGPPERSAGDIRSSALDGDDESGSGSCMMSGGDSGLPVPS